VSNSHNTDNKTAFTRRDFLKASSISIAALALNPQSVFAKDSCCSLIRFGIVTDIHYADRSDNGSRCHRESLDKLKTCVDFMNKQNVDFLIELGDFKDASDPYDTQKTLGYLKDTEAEFAKFKGPRYHVLGNHDMDCITKKQFTDNTTNTNVEKGKTYYSFDSKSHHFIVLDANYNSKNQSYNKGNFAWTDANIPPAQLHWLRNDLAFNNKPTIVFCHQLLDGEGGLYVNNAAQVRKTLEDSNKVLAVFNGHHHGGQYSCINGIHYYTLKAVIENSGPENSAYATVEVYPDLSVNVIGYKKADSMNLKASLPSFENPEKYAYSLPMKVAGKVYMQDTRNPVANVPVTDGVNFVYTDKNGKYEINIATDSTLVSGGVPTVSISRPAGTKAATAWFKRINQIKSGQSVDFALLPDKQSLPFKFVHCTDTHTCDAYQVPFINFRKEMEQAEDDISFVFSSGDICRHIDADGYETARKDLDVYVSQTAKMPMPVYTVPGNHDHAGMVTNTGWQPNNPLRSYGMFTNFVGPLRFSFNHADTHFVGIDWNRHYNGGWAWGAPDIAVDWLEKDLKNIKPGTRIFLFVHFPQTRFLKEEGWYFDDQSKLKKIVKQYNITNIFHGHDHRDAIGSWNDCCITSSGSMSYMSKPDNHDRGLGYRVVSVDKKGIQSFYKKIADPHAINFDSPRFEDVITSEDPIKASFYDPKKQIKKATLSLGDIEKNVDFERTDVCCRVETKLDTKKMAAGFKELKLTVTDGQKSWDYKNTYLLLNDNNPKVTPSAQPQLIVRAIGIDSGIVIKLNDQNFTTLPATKYKGDSDFAWPVKNTEIFTFPIDADKLKKLNKVQFIPNKQKSGKPDRFCVIDVAIKINDKQYKDKRFDYGERAPFYIYDDFSYYLELDS